MKTKTKLLFIGITIFLLFVTSYILPSADDWWSISYIKNNNFSIEKLLPMSIYWRPIQEFYISIFAQIPWAFPLLSHILTVLAHVACGYIIYKLGQIFHIKNNICIWISIYFLFATTAMGTLLSVDSIAQAFATLWGLISLWCFFKYKHLKKYLLWLGCSIMAVFSKESGIVWFVATPLIYLYYDFRENDSLFSKKIFFNFFKSFLIGFVVVVVYFSVRLLLAPKFLNIEDQKLLSGYELTLMVFVKNLFIVFGAGFASVDTAAIVYSKQWFLSIITILLNIPWLLCLITCLIKAIKQRKMIWDILFFIIIAVCVSSPALLVRAGELSPHPTLAIIALFLGIVFNSIDINWKYRFAVVCFIVSALIVDVHKYCLCYQAGILGHQMAKEIKKQTNGYPNNVLLIMVDYNIGPKSGAFFPAAKASFHNGDAALMIYNYKYPKYIKSIFIKDGNQYSINKQIKEVIEKQTEKFDCIWITNREEVRVINLNKENKM